MPSTGLKQREQHRRWAEANPDKMRAYLRRAQLSRYGITLEEYDLLLKAQNAQCAICGRTRVENRNGEHLSVDHDHKTGQVRALLCRRCNQMLGMAQDDAVLLRKAADYIERHRIGDQS